MGAPLVHPLQSVDELLGDAFAAFGPEQAAGDAAVLLNAQGEGDQLFNVLLKMFLLLALRVGRVEINFFQQKRRVEAEVDADVAVAFVGGVVELGAVADDADDARLLLPDHVQAVTAFGRP